MKFNDLYEMDPFQFELLVGQVFAALNYNVLVTTRTSDGGVDLIVDRYESTFHQWIRHVIQVKRYKSTIGIDKIRELNGILDLQRASFGSLITLSDFKQGIKEKIQKDFPRITSLNGIEFAGLLRNAGMLDAEDNVTATTDPNLEKNRKFSILQILRSCQPKSTTESALCRRLKSDFFVTVSDTTIKKDIADLLNSGQLILIRETLFYKPKLSEIQIALNNLNEILKSVDYFVNTRIVFRILEDYYSINREIWETFFEKDVHKMFDQLVKERQLCSVDGNLYATEAALEKFKLSTISSEQMKINIDKLLGINEDTRNKTLKELNFCPLPGKTRMITGTDEESKKLMPFLNILFGICPNPNCGGLLVSMVESICLYVTSNEINSRLNMKEGSIDSQLKEIGHQFHMSELFTNRLKKAITKYFSGDDEIQATIRKGIIVTLFIQIEAKQESTLQELSNKLLDTCIRYQSFINDVYAPIEDFGRPLPILEYKMNITGLQAVDSMEASSC
jgi:hypothetical protein